MPGPMECPHCGFELTQRDLANARFDTFVATSDGCWEWKGGIASPGYGAFTVGNRYTLAHRYQWARHNGPIPKGLFVLHRCDNRSCVRPDHLFVGTQAENLRDMRAKGRERYRGLQGEAHGRAKLTTAEVVEIRRLHREEGWSGLRLAAYYGMGRTSIYHILRNINWRHVA